MKNNSSSIVDYFVDSSNPPFGAGGNGSSLNALPVHGMLANIVSDDEHEYEFSGSETHNRASVTTKQKFFRRKTSFKKVEAAALSPSKKKDENERQTLTTADDGCPMTPKAREIEKRSNLIIQNSGTIAIQSELIADYQKQEIEPMQIYIQKKVSSTQNKPFYQNGHRSRKIEISQRINN